MKSLVCLFVLTVVIESSIAFLCPQPNGFYLHPSNAHKFVRCVNDRAFEYDCPNALVWNQAKGECDWTSGPVVADPLQPVNAEVVAKREQHLICPQQNGYFPHPNPHRFFRCVNGYDHEYVCPADLVWSQAKGQCDYSSNSVLVKQEEKHTEINVPEVQVPQQPSSQPQCLTLNGYFAHPSNPHKYIRCVNGQQYESNCPADLVWNTKKNVCDYSTN